MMTSNKPYFIRALYQWILDNNCTPYIMVDATLPFVDVPQQFVHDGKIILNILPSATHNLNLGDDWITFSARFSGIPQNINIPIGAIAAIYAQENGEGMGFQTEPLNEKNSHYIEKNQSLSTNKKGKEKQQGPKLGVISSRQDEENEKNNSNNHQKGKEEDNNTSPPNNKKTGPKGGLKIIK